MNLMLIRLLAGIALLGTITMAVFGICSHATMNMSDMSNMAIMHTNMSMQDCAGRMASCPLSLIQNLHFFSLMNTGWIVDLAQLVLLLTFVSFGALFFHALTSLDHVSKARWRGYVFHLLRSYPQSDLSFTFSQGILHPKLHVS